MNPEIVRDIRDSHEMGVDKKTLAQKYGVTKANIKRIVMRQTWRHIK